MKSARILNAFQSDGFAEIDMPVGMAERLLSLARQFYAKPLSDRIAAAAFRTPGVLGYYPSESEKAEIHALCNQTVPVFEGNRARGYCSFDFICNEAILSTSELFNANLWPADEALRVEAIVIYLLVSQFMKKLSETIMTELAEGRHLQGLPRNVFNQECCSMMRLLKYTKGDLEKESKAHTDYEFVTLICTDAQGLEIQSPDGSWKMPPCHKNKGLIMPGDMLEVASNGWVQSAVHRVRFGLEDRLSVIFFQGLGLEQKIVYFSNGEKLQSTFGKHLCGMLVRGSPHLQANLQAWEQKLGVKIPERNPFKRLKMG